MACFLIANELQRRKDFDRARAFLAAGMKHLPSALGRPAGAFPIVKLIAGKRGGPVLRRLRRPANKTISGRAV